VVAILVMVEIDAGCNNGWNFGRLAVIFMLAGFA
jgi:hypothetical protein